MATNTPHSWTRRHFGAALLGTLAVGCHKKGRGVAPVIAQGTQPEHPPVAAAGPVEAAPAAATAERYAALAGFCDGVAPTSAAEFAQRQQWVAQALQAAKLDAIVVEPGPAMLYLAGVPWGHSERPFLCVLRADGGMGWVCPAFEQRSAAERLPADSDVRLWNEHEDPYALVASLVRAKKPKVAVDPDARGFIFAGVSSKVRGAKLDGTPIEQVRLRKTEPELARLRRANEATKASIASAAMHLRPGMTQSEFAAELVAAQRAAGLEQVWCLALFGPAASFPHGTREDRALRDDDVVLVDTGGGLHGYRSDVSRTWCVGEVQPQVRDAWHAVVFAQAAALKKIRVGTACSEPDAAARALIESAHFGKGYELFTHRLGHGIGLQVHEPPYLRPENPRALDVGMTMSNEPGIYVPGKFGVRIEDIVAVTHGEPEVLGPPIGPFDDPLAGHLPVS